MPVPGHGHRINPAGCALGGRGSIRHAGGLSRFCCQNEDCPDYGKRGAGNLTVCGRYGKDKQRRLLYCRTCKARFSERKGTPCSAPN